MFNDDNTNVIRSEIIPDRDVINKMIGGKWKKEKYDIKHKYEMFAFLDRLRFFKKSKKTLEESHLLVEAERNLIDKEEMVSKICHLKQIFLDHKKSNDENDDGPYVIYYHKRVEEILKIHPEKKVEELGEMIYKEFVETIIGNKAKFDELKKTSSSIKIKRENLSLIDENVLNYLPSRMRDIENGVENNKENHYIVGIEKEKGEENVDINKENGEVKREEIYFEPQQNDSYCELKRKLYEETCGSPVKCRKISLEHNINDLIVSPLIIRNEFINNYHEEFNEFRNSISSSDSIETTNANSNNVSLMSYYSPVLSVNEGNNDIPTFSYYGDRLSEENGLARNLFAKNIQLDSSDDLYETL